MEPVGHILIDSEALAFLLKILNLSLMRKKKGRDSLERVQHSKGSLRSVLSLSSCRGGQFDALRAFEFELLNTSLVTFGGTLPTKDWREIQRTQQARVFSSWETSKVEMTRDSLISGWSPFVDS